MKIYTELDNIEEITNCLDNGVTVFSHDFTWDDGSSYDMVKFYRRKGDNIFILNITFENYFEPMVSHVRYSKRDDVLKYISEEIKYDHFFIMENTKHLFSFLKLDYDNECFSYAKNKINEFVGANGTNKLVLYKGFYAREVYDLIMNGIKNNKNMVNISTYSEF